MRHSLTNKDIGSLTAVCAVCGPVAITYRKNKDQYQCAIARKRQRGTYLPGVGYMSHKERERLQAAQSGCCAICQKEETLHRDHDHDTGQDRAFLCMNCNTGLGKFSDNPEILEAAATYLRWHNKKVPKVPQRREIAVEPLLL